MSDVQSSKTKLAHSLHATWTSSLPDLYPSPSLTTQCQLKSPTYPKWFVESKAPAQSLHFLASRANQSS